MAISIRSSFAFTTKAPTDALLQFAVADIPEQELLSCKTGLTDAARCARIPAQEDIGERVWVRADGRFEVQHEARVEIRRQMVNLASLKQLEPHQMPAAPVKYLFDSRYCIADKFQTFVDDEFGGTSGGARIEAIRDWVASKFTYAPGSSGPETTATDSFIERRGICRDYAHMVVTLARASVIPARFVACYAPDVTPQDFHAVAEVFLHDPGSESGGTWQLVDATGMATPEDIVKIGVGRDAADVSFLTSFGLIDLCEKDVRVERV
ncbi:transglutaminase-like domain-containing protein [Alteriqipengyuania lutimaris]|uniref:Transglutaminase family protein n=1 Tax=Alteriqipengyuania lutimaris TaxID=1538146 RepID=A0A395LL18_9SPHN|nr:transglutaminase family protein [Alteriqipengyuania lutimaris]MBB3033560.1 transglutaminase-like putative cysteine protease [Alteriqipengyuania lutimaris]RDS77435.1 transglutaminase family protein [Alteriqipengyuania lutimaris]